MRKEQQNQYKVSGAVIFKSRKEVSMSEVFAYSVAVMIDTYRDYLSQRSTVFYLIILPER